MNSSPDIDLNAPTAIHASTTKQAPVNLHGVITGADRNHLRFILACMRIQCGSVLMITSPGHAFESSASLRIKSLDLNSPAFESPLRFPCYRALCEESLSREDADCLAHAWCHVRHQTELPGDYRELLVTSGLNGGSIGHLALFLSSERLPPMLAAGPGWVAAHKVRLRSVDQLSKLEKLGWRPHSGWIRSLNGGRSLVHAEVIPTAWAIASAVTIQDARSTLADVLIGQRKNQHSESSAKAATNPEEGESRFEQEATASHQQAERILERITEVLAGSVSWQPWRERFQVMNASGDDGARVGLILEQCLQESQLRLSQGNTNVLTIIIDHEAATHPLAQTAAEVILRTGRKVNCTLIALADSYPVPMWSDFGGFYIYEHLGVSSLVIAGNQPVPITEILTPGLAAQAHHMMQTGVFPAVEGII